MNFIIAYLIVFTIALLGAIICYGLIIFGLIKEVRDGDKCSIVLASTVFIITTAILVVFIIKILVITGGVTAWIS